MFTNNWGGIKVSTQKISTIRTVCVLVRFLLTPWQHSQKHTAVITIVYFKYCLIVNFSWKHLTATNSCLLETGMENVNTIIEKTQIIHFRDLTQVWQKYVFSSQRHDHLVMNSWWHKRSCGVLHCFVLLCDWLGFSIYLMTKQRLCGNMLSWGERLSVLSRRVGSVKFETLQQRAHLPQITMFTLYVEQTLHLAMWMSVKVWSNDFVLTFIKRLRLSHSTNGVCLKKINKENKISTQAPLSDFAWMPFCALISVFLVHLLLSLLFKTINSVLLCFHTERFA